MVKVEGLSDVTNYTIRAIILEIDEKSNKNSARITSFVTDTCKQEGFFRDVNVEFLINLKNKIQQQIALIFMKWNSKTAT
jgi:hypothetical protein